MRLSLKFLCFLLLTQFGAYSGAYAELRLPALIADHMVLQRGIKTPVWGWASPGAKVTVIFKNKTYSITADPKGKWLLKLDASIAGGPYDLSIQGDGQQRKIKDVLIGDVWICSGQSNMVFDFNNGRARLKYANEIAASKNDKIRQILVARNTSAIPAQDFKTRGWKSASPENINDFSVAAYFFAKELYDKYQVPIGLINTSWGGTKIESWIDEDALKNFPQFNPAIRLLHDTVQVEAKVQERKAIVADWHQQNKTADKGYENGTAVWAAPAYNDSAWKDIKAPVLFDKFGFPNTFGVIWFRKEIDVPQELAGKAAVIRLGSVDDEDETFVNGVRVGGYANREKPREHLVEAKLLKAGKNVIAVRIINWNGPGGFAGDQPMVLDFGTSKIPLNGDWKYQPGRIAGQLPNPYNIQDLPTSLYNGMIAPLIPYAIKGAIWYQGENNSSRGYEYRDLLPAMIANWRSLWNQGDFPFVFQQLVNFQKVQPQPGASEWAELREAQLMTLSRSPNTAMSVGIDIGEGNDIHPVNKLDVGKRLALGAEKIAYGEKGVVYSGPIYKSVAFKNGQAIVSFSQAGSGLANKDELTNGKRLSNGKRLAGKNSLVNKSGVLKYFAIAGANKKFYWAEAIIKGNQVVVYSKDVQSPVAVRYAWADNPEGCNLINKEGLPAAPFRTDDWR